MFQASVNDKWKFEVERKGTALTVNGVNEAPDIRALGGLKYHVLHHTASCNVEVVQMDTAAKTAEIKVNGNTYHIAVKDQFDLLLDQLGMSAKTGARVSELKAPMPGLVLKLFVKEGDNVEKGANLFILEAMKMENIIKAPADVTVKAVKIKPGDKVEKGQVLLLF